MKISRRFTTKDTDVYTTTEWATRSSKIKNPDGSVVFAMDDAQIPKEWSQLATDIVVSKYFRKAEFHKLQQTESRQQVRSVPSSKSCIDSRDAGNTGEKRTDISKHPKMRRRFTMKSHTCF